MNRTSKQIQGDVLRLLKDSTLASLVSGKIYRNGYRPRDSKAEDIIVIFTTGLASEIQSGVVTINIYVPDIDPYQNGVLTEDGQRCEDIEVVAAKWVASLTTDKSNYKFELQQTIYTEAEPEINQHFIVIKLKYKLFTND